MDTLAGLAKLFCESLDRFVTIRVFSPDQALDLLRHVPAGSRRDYASFLVKATIVNFETDVAKLIAPPACNEIVADVILRELYGLCVRANPGLDVRAIEIPGTGDQVQRFCDSLDHWVVVKRLSRAEQVTLTQEVRKLEPALARSRILTALYPSMQHDRANVGPEEYDLELDQNELLAIGLKVNPQLKDAGLGSPDDDGGAHAVPGMPRGTPIERLLWVMDRLRDPEKGCPWDRQQTHESLKPYLIEEAHEVLEAIDSGVVERIQEELGDVLLQVVFHARLAQEQGLFDFDRIASTILAKLVHRHPHVFGGPAAATAEDVLKNWEAIKKLEKKKESVVDGIPATMPTQLRAFRLQEKASIVAPGGGSPFDPRVELDRVVSPFLEAVSHGDGARVGETYGDMLFGMVNLGRLLKQNAEFCLEQANGRFTEKMKRAEALAKSQNRALEKMSLDELDKAASAAAGA